MNLTLLYILFAFIGCYLLVMRPILHRLSCLKAFYAQSDTFWSAAWAFAFKSLTVAWTYLVAAVGFMLNQLDNLAALVGDPEFKTQVTQFIGSDTTKLGAIMIAFSMITFAARMRSMPKA